MMNIGTLHLLVAEPPATPAVVRAGASASLVACVVGRQGSQVSFANWPRACPGSATSSRACAAQLGVPAEAGDPAIETVQIAIWGTLLADAARRAGVLPAARNLTPNLGVSTSCGRCFNVTRGINEIILALIFVAAVGLGPFPACWPWPSTVRHARQVLLRIDRGDRPGPDRGAASTGAGPMQIIIFGVIPQVITAWIAVVLYRFETNLRQATVLGMVGAGGIGFELVGSMKLFQYQDTATCILVIIAMVMAAD
jgi:phosphonate transport system permease protein